MHMHRYVDSLLYIEFEIRGHFLRFHGIEEVTDFGNYCAIEV